MSVANSWQCPGCATVRLGAQECFGTPLTCTNAHPCARRRSRVAQAEVCKTFHAGSIPAAASISFESRLLQHLGLYAMKRG